MYSQAPSIRGSLKIASKTVREIEGANVPKARTTDEILASKGISAETRAWFAATQAKKAARRR